MRTRDEAARIEATRNLRTRQAEEAARKAEEQETENTARTTAAANTAVRRALDAETPAAHLAAARACAAAARAHDASRRYEKSGDYHRQQRDRYDGLSRSHTEEATRLEQSPLLFPGPEGTTKEPTRAPQQHHQEAARKHEEAAAAMAAGAEDRYGKSDDAIRATDIALGIDEKTDGWSRDHSTAAWASYKAGNAQTEQETRQQHERAARAHRKIASRTTPPTTPAPISDVEARDLAEEQLRQLRARQERIAAKEAREQRIASYLSDMGLSAIQIDGVLSILREE